MSPWWLFLIVPACMALFGWAGQIAAWLWFRKANSPGLPNTPASHSPTDEGRGAPLANSLPVAQGVTSGVISSTA